ncbi:MAG: hypothetical protein ACRD2E_01160 [Terriglobales bacterium]
MTLECQEVRGGSRTATEAIFNKLLRASVTDFQLARSGGAGITLTLAATGTITFTNGLGQSVTCSAGAGEYVVACGSASGGGALLRDSDSAGPAYFMITSASETPLTFQAYGSGAFTISQSAPPPSMTFVLSLGAMPIPPPERSAAAKPNCTRGTRPSPTVRATSTVHATPPAPAGSTSASS